MGRNIFFSFCLLTGFFTSAQTTTDIGVWLDHLPYSNGVDVVENNNLVYCATVQGLFIYDNIEKTIQRLSKINGLSDVGLTCLAWSDDQQTLLIGYSNGNMDLLIGDEVINAPEILLSGNFSGLKSINAIETRGTFAYLCTNFGIVQYDIRERVVRETFIIGSEGNPVAVYDLTFSDDSIHAATEEGLLEASTDDQLIDFQNWNRNTRIGRPLNHVAYFDGMLVANKPTPPNLDSVFYQQAGQWVYANELLFMSNVLDLNVDKGLLLVGNGFSAVAYEPGFKVKFNMQAAQTGFAGFKGNGTAVSGNLRSFWVADGEGLYQGFLQNDGFFVVFNHKPNSPATQKVFSMTHDGERMFVGPGEINDVWAPQFNNDGFFTLTEFSWNNVPSTDFNTFKDIVALASDPSDPSHFYASSYGNGILEFRDNQYQGIINSSNSSIHANSSGDHRIGGFSADAEGNIWFSNSLTDSPLGVIRNDGEIEVYSLGSAANSSTALRKILYTSQDQIWLQTRTSGAVVAYFDESGILRSRRLTANEGSGNLPTETVLAFAEDLDGEIWIGTDEGMAVLFSPQNIFEPNRNYDAQIIVIDEDGDGNGERVLGSERINDIEVDGSNKKWFATATQGVFYTSENAREQIFNFNTDNSPLPSNNVLDIEIDDVTGMVYFGTDQGIVSFQGQAPAGVEVHREVFAYPNPVTPNYDGPILIRGLVTNAQVKITDIEGNIIFETIAEGGQAVWNGRNFDGRRASSGVYLAYITNDDGTQTAITKILIQN